MKRKWFQVVILTIILLILPIKSSAEESTIYTRVSQLEVLPTSGVDENYSYFIINTTSEILNSDDNSQQVMIDEYTNSIIIESSLANESVEVEQETLFGWEETFQTSDAGVTQVNSGITQNYVTTKIRINLSSQDIIPEGNYIFSYKFSYDDDIRYNTTLSVDNGTYNISYPNFPEINNSNENNANFFKIQISIIGLFLLYNIKRKRIFKI